MGSVKKRVRDGKTTWVARWREADDRQRKRSFDRKMDADKFLVKVEGSLLAGSYIDPDAALVKMNEWAARWLSTQSHLKKSTYVGYEGVVTGHILPRWGKLPLSKISHADIAAWMSEVMDSGLSPSRVRLIHGTLFRILKLAVKDGRLPRNPAHDVDLPRILEADKRYLTHEQVADLAEAAGEYGTAVEVLAYCGLRFGELVSLRVGRVDVLRRRLLIAQSSTEVSGELVESDTKGHERRSVPFPKFLADDLARHLEGKAPDDRVFTSPQGEPLRNGNWRRDCFDAAAKTAGLDGLTPHELRHTAASLAISESASGKAVQRMLGHKSAAMTYDVYTGLFEDDLDDVADRLDEGARRARLAPRTRPQGQVTEIHRKRKSA